MERGFLTTNTKPKKNNGESGVMNNEGLDEASIEGIAAKIKNIDGKLRMPIRGEPLKSSRAAHVPSVEKGSKVENIHTYVGGPPIKSILKKAVTFEMEAANKEGTEKLSGSSQCVKENVADLGISDRVHASDFATSDHSFASVLCPKAVVHKGDFRTLFNEEIIADSDCVLPKAATDLVKNRISFARALIEIDARFVLKKEVIMAIPEEVGNGHIMEVIRLEYEWKPPHCVECQIFGHNLNSCPKQVKSPKKKKVVDPRSFGGLRLKKPNSKVIWQQKKEETTGESGKQTKVSEHANSDLNVNEKKAHEPSSLKSACDNQLEDECFDCYDGYEDQVVDLQGALKEFGDFKLSMSGRR
nr:hypothetical protein [Tanacetum cinerariifolium]